LELRRAASFASLSTFRRKYSASALIAETRPEHFDRVLADGKVSKLTPLGDPAPNAPKWFAAVEMIRLAVDQDWLHKATMRPRRIFP